MLQASRSLRLLLVLVVLGGFVVTSTTGCSLFKKKKTAPVAENVNTGDTPADAPQAGPTDSIEDGNRITEPQPFPELTVIYFDYDKSNIRADQLDKAEKNLQYLLAHPADKVLIEGHTDERGTVEYNFALGERRASAVRDYYVRGGIAAERVAIISKGEEEPAVVGGNEAAWGKNRRTEFKKIQ